MSAPDFETVEGDDLPIIAQALLDEEGDPVSLTEDDIVMLRIQRSGGRDDPIEVECEVTTLSPAVVESASVSGLEAGRYEARFVIDFGGDVGRRSFPNSTPLYIRVRRNLAAEEASS